MRILAIFACLFCCLLSSPAYAQTVTTYTNSTDSTPGDLISGTRACSIAGAFQRNIVVTDSFTITDINVGVLHSHGQRSDTAHFIRSPAGTIVRLKTTTGGAADNLNVLFDDQAATSINGHTANDTATAGTSVPPYQRTFIPNQPLNAAIAGQNSAGTWTLFICDLQNNGIDGEFFQFDLFLTQAPTNFADLSLSKTVSNPTPAAGTTVNYTLTVTNSGASTDIANGVQVTDNLPLGVTFNSFTGDGSYNPTTGIWNVGTIPVGASRSITINVTIDVGNGTTIQNVAEITASSVPDIDSTVNNGSRNEDDDADVSFTTTGTRVAGIPPSFTCPVGNTLFDWNGITWPPSTASSQSNSFAVTNVGNVTYDVSTQGTFLANVTVTGDNNGGVAETGLYQLVDYTNRTQATTTVITLPTAVPGAQFTVFDIDFAANDFADRLEVIGSFNGTTVIPTLTNGIANYVIGNVAIGDAGAANNTADGDVIVTFNSPVDTITVIYGNHTTAPADPDGQAASVGDIDFCNPQVNLSIVKLSNVLSDGFSGSNPKAIPGATVRYCILISNAGSGTATNVAMTDDLPDNVTFVAGSMATSDGCAGTLTSEDDDATGADETDPAGMAFDAAAGTNGQVTGNANSLGPGDSLALIFNAILD